MTHKTKQQIIRAGIYIFFTLVMLFFIALANDVRTAIIKNRKHPYVPDPPIQFKTLTPNPQREYNTNIKQLHENMKKRQGGAGG